MSGLNLFGMCTVLLVVQLPATLSLKCRVHGDQLSNVECDPLKWDFCVIRKFKEYEYPNDKLPIQACGSCPNGAGCTKGLHRDGWWGTKNTMWECCCQSDNCNSWEALVNFIEHGKDPFTDTPSANPKPQGLPKETASFKPRTDGKLTCLSINGRTSETCQAGKQYCSVYRSVEELFASNVGYGCDNYNTFCEHGTQCYLKEREILDNQHFCCCTTANCNTVELLDAFAKEGKQPEDTKKPGEKRPEAKEEKETRPAIRKPTPTGNGHLCWVKGLFDDHQRLEECIGDQLWCMLHYVGNEHSSYYYSACYTEEQCAYRTGCKSIENDNVRCCCDKSGCNIEGLMIKNKGDTSLDQNKNLGNNRMSHSGGTHQNMKMMQPVILILALVQMI